MSDLSKYPYLEQYVQNLKSIPEGLLAGRYRADTYLRGEDLKMDAFRMGATPVTWGLWKEYVDSRRYSDDPVRLEDPGWGFPDNHPVVNVSWNDIMKPGSFADWVSRLAGFRLTLPTGNQWVYAQLGGKDTNYPWGDEFDNSKSWGAKKSRLSLSSLWHYVVRDLFDPSKTAAVDRTDRIFTNGYGLTDMCGNVTELCDDAVEYWGLNDRELEIDRSNLPFIIARDKDGRIKYAFDSNLRLVQSNSWDDSASDDLINTHSHIHADQRTNTIGFRLSAGPK